MYLSRHFKLCRSKSAPRERASSAKKKKEAPTPPSTSGKAPSAFIASAPSLKPLSIPAQTNNLIVPAPKKEDDKIDKASAAEKPAESTRFGPFLFAFLLLLLVKVLMYVRGTDASSVDTLSILVPAFGFVTVIVTAGSEHPFPKWVLIAFLWLTVGEALYLTSPTHDRKLVFFSKLISSFCLVVAFSTALPYKVEAGRDPRPPIHLPRIIPVLVLGIALYQEVWMFARGGYLIIYI
jgi:hypothetical protein